MPPSQRSEQSGNPVLVELQHGPRIESAHRGVIAITNDKGEVLWSTGRIEDPACIRSALKPLQALALLETGAFEALNLRPEHLANACGSHSGEPKHTQLVESWLRHLHLTVDDLECGCASPLDSKARRQLTYDHQDPTALHHNCSGKHAGFLSVASHLGAGPKNYVEPGHPVQKKVLACLETALDSTITVSNLNVDGCSAPNLFAPFQDFASAFGRFMSTEPSAPMRDSRQQILAAMAQHADLVSGTHRFSYRLSQSAHSTIIGKSGAEGSYLAMIPESRIAILLKIDDGAKRAGQAALLAILSRLGLIGKDAAADLAPAFHSSRGKPIGHFQPAALFQDLTPDMIRNDR